MKSKKMNIKFKDYSTKKNNLNFFCNNNFKDYSTCRINNTKVATAINEGAGL